MASAKRSNALNVYVKSGASIRTEAEGEGGRMLRLIKANFASTREP